MNTDIPGNYKNKSQKARVITEAWLLENFKCPFCNSKLAQYTANNKCTDYYCKKCNEDFELKTINGKFPKGKMNGASYKATLEKINSDKSSHWILLEHNNFTVNRLTFIPKFFFYDEMIEPRKELSKTAKRHGWQGCKISLNMIPSFGKISYIKNNKEVDDKIINYKLEKASGFKNANLKNKNWKLEILSLIDSVPETVFSASDLYEYIPALEEKHPDNHNIDAKIRETLQQLRDEGYVKFLDKEGFKGLYQKLF
ncbi:restriction endonuclease [Candidatus Saccharibacteria bacterium]|nr:restriction endonuclease [Candidatus Saccharibacteria bacterium]